MKRLFVAGLVWLALGAVLPGSARAAETIPTRVVGPAGSSEYPDPICSTCVVKTVKTAGSTADSATIDVEYLEWSSFDGDILVTVLLFNGRHDELVISDVHLDYQEQASFDLVSSQDWSWDDVESIWFELVPT